MNKNRKGFTIVELVIVIAIIAILAAVLIPTFASLIAKANVSADTQLVRNLNTALTTEKAGGENNKTMNDALKMAKNAGYDIDRIVSKSGNNIGWDSKNDRFVLIDANNDTYIYPTDAGSNAQKIQNAVDYFVIYKEIPTQQKYSIYLSKDATLADGTVNISVGFDAGENESVKTVKYENATKQSVIIRTNGGTLNVNGAESSIDHYGAANLIDIEKVKDASFHEFGSAAVVTVTSGRFVAESTAKVLRVHAAASTAKLAEVSGANVVEYTKAANVEVTVENSTKEVAETSETLDAIKNTGKNTELVAEGGVAEINGIQFKDLQSAFTAAKDGDTVKIINDYTYTKELSLTKNLTIDFNGHTLTANLTPVTSAITIEKSKLTLNDSSSNKTGKLISNQYGISAELGGTVIVNDITIESDFACLTGNNKRETMNFEVHSGTLTSKYSEAIYMPGQQLLTISGGVINGGISMRMGTLNMTGGIVNGMRADQTADPISTYYNYAGSAWIGDAIYVLGGTYSSSTETTDCVINITGGTINGNAHRAICVYDVGTKYAQKITVTVSENVSVNGDVTIDRNFTNDTNYKRTYPVEATITTPSKTYN